MKPFNLQEYHANPSQKVVTRDGKAVRIICTDAKSDRPIIGLVTYDDIELVYDFIGDGKWSDRNEEDNFDLFFAPKQGDGWVNIYRRKDGRITLGSFHNKKEDAITEASGYNMHGLIATAKLEWKE